MSYRTFRNDEDQAAAEQSHPDRFNDGTGWLALAVRATTKGAARIYTPEQWAAMIGAQPSHLTQKLTAAELWELFPDYEAERLRAQWVTLEGVANIEAKKQELYIAIRALREPTAILGHRFAIDILDQALLDPDRRADFVKLARSHDALGVQLYHAAEERKIAKPIKRLAQLVPGQCIPTKDLHPDDAKWWDPKKFYGIWKPVPQICRKRSLSFTTR